MKGSVLGIPGAEMIIKPVELKILMWQPSTLGPLTKECFMAEQVAGMKLQELIPGLLIGAGEVPAPAKLSEMGIGRILQLQWVDYAGPEGPEGEAEAEPEVEEVEAVESVEPRENGEVQVVLLEWKDGEWLQGEVLS